MTISDFVFVRRVKAALEEKESVVIGNLTVIRYLEKQGFKTDRLEPSFPVIYKITRP